MDLSIIDSIFIKLNMNDKQLTERRPGEWSAETPAGLDLRSKEGAPGGARPASKHDEGGDFQLGSTDPMGQSHGLQHRSSIDLDREKKQMTARQNTSDTIFDQALREKRQQREQEQLRIMGQPGFKKEFGDFQNRLQKDFQGIFGSDQDVQQQVLSDAAQKNTDPSLLPSLLSSKGERSASKRGPGLGAAHPKHRIKAAQLVPRFLMHDKHLEATKSNPKTASVKIGDETLGGRGLVQKKGNHFAARHARNSIDVNGQNDAAKRSMAAKDQQMRISGSQVVHAMYTTEAQSMTHHGGDNKRASLPTQDGRSFGLSRGPPGGKDPSIFSSINTNHSIMAGGLNVNPGDELMDSYQSTMSNAGVKKMFRQLRHQAKEVGAGKTLRF